MENIKMTKEELVDAMLDNELHLNLITVWSKRRKERKKQVGTEH